MILWSDPTKPGQEFLMSIDDADRAGWHEALIKYDGDEPKQILKTAKNILKEQGFYRPHDRWMWDKVDVTYMRSSDVYFKLKVRRKAPEGEEEE